MAAVTVEVAPVPAVGILELAIMCPSSELPSAPSSYMSSPTLSPSIDGTPSPSALPADLSDPCPQPSPPPLSPALAASLLEPAPFSLDSASLPSASPARGAAVRSAALSVFGLRSLLLASGPSPFAPIGHRLGWARRLFCALSHPVLLLSASLALCGVHVLLLYLSGYTLYLLYASSAPLSPLATFVFTVHLGFLLARSAVSLALLALRMRRPHLWLSVPAADAPLLSRCFHPTHLVLRVLSLLMLLMATAALIFGTPLALSSRPLLALFVLLSYDAITLALPLLVVPALALLLPLHSLHMSFPYVPLAPRRPAQPRPGMSAAQLALLGDAAWSPAAGCCESELCAVCLCELEAGERVRRLPKCSHVFHRGCIDQWLERRANCPLCVRTVEAAV